MTEPGDRHAPVSAIAMAELRKKGLIGRWRNYIDSKHGDNKRLKELLAKDPQRYAAFSFSILRTLSRSLTSKEVIAIEGKYKAQLGTRAFGLNAN